MDNNNIYITLPVKNIKVGLLTPPLLDRAVNQSGLITIGTTMPQSTQSLHYSPSPQYYESVSEAIPI